METKNPELYAVIKTDNIDKLKFLSQQPNFNYNQKVGIYGASMINLAALFKSINCLKYLLSQPTCSVKNVDSLSVGLYHNAIYSLDNEILKLVLANPKVPIDTKDGWKETPIISASKNKTMFPLFLRHPQLRVKHLRHINQFDRNILNFGYMGFDIFICQVGNCVGLKGSNDKIFNIFFEKKYNNEFREWFSKENENDRQNCQALLSDETLVSEIKEKITNSYLKDKYVGKYVIRVFSNVEPFEQDNSSKNEQDFYNYCKNGNLSFVEVLINENDINQINVDECGSSCLQTAVVGNHLDVVQKLLSKYELNINYQNYNGLTALMFATTKERLDIFKLLLPLSNVNITNNEQGPALWYAVLENNFEAVKLLVDSGADVNAGNNYFNPLTLAVKNKNNQKIAQYKAELGKVEEQSSKKSTI